MSFDKTIVYNVKFNLKSLEANCQRASCKVHIFIKIQNQERKFKEIGDMKKNVALFNSEMVWDFVPIRYDEVSGTFFDTPVIISIHYETSEQGARTNKLKVGQVTVNLAKLLNSKTYRINSQYSVEKCYDPNAKLKMAIDLTQVDETHNIQMHSEQGIGQYRSAVRQSGVNWRVSKIREKMNEDEKTMLQNKLYEYEDKMEKYRDSHNEQIKRLSEQIDKKQERILTITTENGSIAQALQNCQVQLEKYKSRLAALEKENLQQQEAIRYSNQTRESASRELAKTKTELEESSSKIEQLEIASSKKQQHYKQQLQKYTQRYMESENGRNKIVFELQNKLKEELQKKDEYYADLLSKLQSKVQLHGQSSKETIFKKEKEMVVLVELYEKVERERTTFQTDLRLFQQEKQEWLTIKSELEEQVNLLTTKIKNVQSQYEMCSFSNSNLQRELQRMKSQGKIQTKSLEELKYEIQLANKTMEEQESMIVKLNREIKTHKQREYYMEEKYQDQLEQKTYNEECIKGSNYFYKGQVKKHQIKIKFLEEKIEDMETTVGNSSREKQKLQEEIKNSNRLIFENGHQLLRLQSENKKLTQKLDELQFEKNQKQLILKDTEEKFAAHIVQHDQQVNDYIVTINQLQRQIKQISQRRTEDANQWELQFESESNEKNSLLSQLEMELEKLKISERSLKERLLSKEQRQLQLENELGEQKQKTRTLERQAVKTKFELKRLTDEKESFSRQQSKYKKSVNELRNQISACKNQLQKQSKKLINQKESYIGLIKWILDRNWEDGNKQFVQHASPDIELEMITFVNTGLERIYSIWEKNMKRLQQMQQDNEKLLEQVAHHRLEQQYQQQFAKNDKIELELHSIQYRIDRQFVDTKPSHSIPQPIVDLSSSFDVIKNEELKNINSQLQREISLKNAEIQTLNQQLFEQRTKSRELNDELRNIKEEIEDLSLAIGKKTATINSLQAQLAERDFDMSGSLSYMGSRSPARTADHRAEVEAKYKEQKAVAQMESKVEELNRENELQKSKIELLQGRLRVTSQKNLSDSQKISSLEKILKEREEELRKSTKENDEKQKQLDKANKEIEIVLSKVSKKDASIEELRTQVQQYKRINQTLANQVESWQRRFAQKEKMLQKQSSMNQKLLLQTAQNLAMQKMERDKLNMQQGAQITSLKSSVKQAQRRIGSLQGLLKRAKQENEQLHQKYLKSVQSLSEAEESIKDMKMSESMARQNNEKIVNELNERLQQKQFELEEVRFTSESRIMQLEKQLQQR